MGTGGVGAGSSAARGVPGWICSLGPPDPLIPAGWGLPPEHGNAEGAGIPQELLLGWARTSWVNVHCSLDLIFSCFLFVWSIDPLLKLGLPSWVYQSPASTSIPRRVFFLGSSPGFGKAAALPGEIQQGEAAGSTGEPSLSHLAQHIQAVCRGCSSHPCQRHKDLNLLFWQVQGAHNSRFPWNESPWVCDPLKEWEV